MSKFFVAHPDGQAVGPFESKRSAEMYAWNQAQTQQWAGCVFRDSRWRGPRLVASYRPVGAPRVGTRGSKFRARCY